MNPITTPDPDRLLTQAEVGQRFGVTRQRVQQIEDAALGKFCAGILADPAVQKWIEDNRGTMTPSALRDSIEFAGPTG